MTYRRRGTLAYAVLMVCGLGLVITALCQPGPSDTRVLIFALALVPMVNAVFDYLSYGLTLTLIRAGQKGRLNTVFAGVIDIAVAGLILIGLSTTLAGLVAVINHLSATPLFDLAQVLRDLGDPQARGAYAWLWISLLTTLVPTAIHLILVILSAPTLLPMPWKETLAAIIADPRNEASTWAGLVAVAAIGAVYLTGVAWLLWYLYGSLTDHVGSLAELVLWGVRLVLSAFGVVAAP